jgi:hypothetical protein
MFDASHLRMFNQEVNPVVAEGNDGAIALETKESTAGAPFDRPVATEDLRPYTLLLPLEP